LIALLRLIHSVSVRMELSNPTAKVIQLMVCWEVGPVGCALWPPHGGGP